LKAYGGNICNWKWIKWLRPFTFFFFTGAIDHAPRIILWAPVSWQAQSDSLRAPVTSNTIWQITQYCWHLHNVKVATKCSQSNTWYMFMPERLVFGFSSHQKQISIHLAFTIRILYLQCIYLMSGNYKLRTTPFYLHTCRLCEGSKSPKATYRLDWAWKHQRYTTVCIVSDHL
jgi:hypothetical protein